VWSAAFVKFNWEASWVPLVSLLPQPKNNNNNKKNPKRDTLHAQRVADASLYFRHMFGVGVLDVVLLFVYYLFRFNYLFVMMTMKTRLMKMGPAEKSDSHTYWNYCFIIISKEFWPTLEC